jgi:hypothetical protein
MVGGDPSALVASPRTPPQSSANSDPRTIESREYEDQYPDVEMPLVRGHRAA